MKSLTGKTAFVTGGASGIGVGIARAFLHQGMQVVIADINDSNFDAVLADLGGGDRVRALRVDIADRQDVERAADEAESLFGNVHVLCNNAGIGCSGPGHTAPVEQWERVVNVNLHGTFNGIQVFVPRIRKHGEGGHIVNTSSMTGLYPNRSQFVYGATKYAIVGMSEFLRDDLENEGIAVSVLCPNTVLTPMSAFRDRPGDTDEIRRKRAEYLQQHGIVLESPDNVGEMVVRGILNDEMYIFTDGKQSRQMLETRFHNLMTAMERQFPDDKN